MPDQGKRRITNTTRSLLKFMHVHLCFNFLSISFLHCAEQPTSIVSTAVQSPLNIYIDITYLLIVETVYFAVR